MRCLVLPGTVTRALVSTFTVATAAVLTLVEPNTVLFISLAVIEVVEGKTDRIDGYVTLESDRFAPGELSGPTGFYLDVDLANLDTRLGLSNRHMRNNCL